MDIKLVEDAKLNEIYQSVAMRFAFANLRKSGDSYKVKQLHPFVKCRDFLGDAMWASKFRKPYKIYGFSFDGTKQRVQLGKTVMLIEYSKIDRVKNNLRVLNYFESKVRWKPSKLIDIKVKSKTPVTLAIGSGMWMKSPALISLYTLLWRLSGIGIKEHENVDEFIQRCSKLKGNDGTYLSYILNTSKKLGIVGCPIFMVMKRWGVIFQDTYKYGEKAYNYDVHENHGIKSLFRLANEGKVYKNFDMEKFPYFWAKNLVSVVEKEKNNA